MLRHKPIPIAHALTVVLVLVALHSAARACSCFPTATVLDAYERANIVATFRFVSADRGSGHRGVTSATLEVTKVFKGAVTVGQQFRFAQGGGSDCIWEWDEERVGNEYLLYLGEPSVGHSSFGANDERAAYGPMYYVSVCGRSTSLKGAADDLSFLNRLNILGGKTRLSGTVKAWYDDEIPKANIPIRIIGTRKIYLTKTDAHGFYEIYGLPAGRYVVRPAVPFGWKYEDYMINQSPSVIRDLVTNRVQ